MSEKVYEDATRKIVESATKLLNDGTVATVLGFAESGLSDNATAAPCFATTAEEAQKLIWNDRCVPALGAYLAGPTGAAMRAAGRVALVAKPCDARALTNLILEQQLAREDVYVIGMECGGMKDEEGQPLAACAECDLRTPPVSDELIDGAPDGAAPGQKPDAADEDYSPERFNAELDKCILCFSCRQACYGCYCDVCFMDRGVPSWQAATPDRSAKMVYHLGRAMHLAGRCVECGACENACASGVDVRYLIRAATRFIGEEYGFRAGLDTETPPAMLTHKTEDREVGFWGSAVPADAGTAAEGGDGHG